MHRRWPLSLGALAAFLAIAQTSASPPATETLIFERATGVQRALAAARIVEALEGSGVEPELQPYRIPNEFWVQDLFLPPVSGTNIVGKLKASSATTRTIVVGAHYDTKQGSPGADDNASGTLAVIALAKRLAAFPERSANIIFVLFDQEEQGSMGSNVFAAQWQRSGRALHSMHNIDMIGYDANGDGLLDLDVPDGDVADAYTAAAAELNIPINRATFDSSDHISFRARGFTAAFLTENLSGGDFNPTYHSPDDTRINQAYMDSAIDLMTATLERLVAP